jgi:ribosome maturation factor RimP
LEYKNVRTPVVLLAMHKIAVATGYNPRFTTKRAGIYRPFFLGDCFSHPLFLQHLDRANTQVAVQDIITQTVAGLGYDLVEVQRSAGGLLRITIDLPWTPPAADSQLPEQFVTVEDCEKVNRQLLFALEVDGVDYKRLEVSSPGIDRPLRHEKDFERFAGQVVDLTLKAPIGVAAAAGQVNATRKKFRGTLERVEGQAGGVPGWQIVWSDAPAPKPGQRVSKKRVPPPLQAMGFTLDELREARLAPIVSFKGRGVKDDTPVSND